MRRKLFNRGGVLVDEDGNAVDYIDSAWDVRRWMYPSWKEKPVSKEATLEIKTAPIRSVVVGLPLLIHLPPNLFVNVRELKEVVVRNKDSNLIDVSLYDGGFWTYEGERGLTILRQLEAHCYPAILLEPKEAPPIPYPFGPTTIPGWSKLSALDAGRSKEANQTVFEWAAGEIERLRAKCLKAGLGT